MMDMPMKDGMDKKMSKDAYFKCPSCGTELCAKEMPKKENSMKKDNAASMPMDSLKNKISSGPTMNLNSY